MDVVTLLPSATEIACALGVEPVATSHECDYPPGVEDLLDATVANVDADGSSREIDEAVARAEDGAGVFDVRAGLLERLDPDLVVTQGICDVCAVDDVLVERVLAERDLDADVLTTDPHRLSDLYEDVRTIGAAIDRTERAEQVVAELRQRVHDVRRRTGDERGRTTDGDERPSVAVLDWLDPVMVAGHWTPELVEIAGGTYPMASPAERSRPREWDAVRETDPDVLVLAPCGFEIEQTVRSLEEATELPGWDQLEAVRRDRVYVVDGHNYVNRPGPRLIETLEYFAGLLQPDADAPPSHVARPLTAIDEPAD